tara:strand:- start:977 stop:2044 length:1068 start_codon:yes stop_codon:yes gene_type:complete
MDIDNEWDNFLESNLLDTNQINIENKKNCDIKCSELYISTKTKIIYINQDVDIYSLFWEIPIIEYYKQECGIIKKQIKISLKNKEESDNIDKIINNITSYKKINILNYINNPSGRIIYKDIRKITVGLSKKDLLFTKNTNKSAFYNCFVLTMRLFDANVYKEFHVKIFNTGKIEIPGIQNDEIVFTILNNLNDLFKNISNINININIDKNKIENVLINSNFNCGFYINREALFNILRNKYFINACYDPCSYPGIQCVYYFDKINNCIITEAINFKNIKLNNNIIKISYMIFRTGSILIVGKCSETILNYVYNFIKDILLKEYSKISLINNNDTTINNVKANKSIKCKKKFIYTNN